MSGTSGPGRPAPGRLPGRARRNALAAAACAATVLLTVGVTLAVMSRSAEPAVGTRAAAGTASSPTASDRHHQKLNKEEKGAAVTTPSGSPVVRTSPATSLPAGRPVSCPAATVTVHTAAELITALRAAKPGTSIALADGTYRGTFVATASGTAEHPVWLCGGRGAVLDGGGTDDGYGLHLNPAEHWRLVGFTVRNAQKGVVADGTMGTIIQDLLVELIGDEGIHLRSASSGNVVSRNTVRRTGVRKPKFGEGIYIGSATGNWSKYSAGGPDRSDGNLVQGNTLSETTAESVDIKEGTTGGALLGNRFDGAGLVEADSWVDVKGNDWVIADNVGRSAGKDGFQTHRITDAWGSGNVFRANTAADRGSGVDFYIHKPEDTHNRVQCDNRTGSGAAAISNIPCTD